MRNRCCGQYGNCELLIQEYHKLLKQAENLFDTAETIIDTDVISSLIRTIKSLKHALETQAKGLALEIEAATLIDNSSCGNICDKTNPECENLLNQLEEQFKLEYKAQLRTLRLLKEALKSIKESIKYRDTGYALYDQYKHCVHNKPVPPVPPVPPYPPNPPCHC